MAAAAGSKRCAAAAGLPQTATIPQLPVPVVEEEADAGAEVAAAVAAREAEIAAAQAWFVPLNAKGALVMLKSYATYRSATGISQAESGAGFVFPNDCLPETSRFHKVEFDELLVPSAAPVTAAQSGRRSKPALATWWRVSWRTQTCWQLSGSWLVSARHRENVTTPSLTSWAN